MFAPTSIGGRCPATAPPTVCPVAQPTTRAIASCKKRATNVAGRRRRTSKRKTRKAASCSLGDRMTLGAAGGQTDLPLIARNHVPPAVPKVVHLKKRLALCQSKKDPKRFNMLNKYKSGKQNRSDRRSAQRNTSF